MNGSETFVRYVAQREEKFHCLFRLLFSFPQLYYITCIYEVVHNLVMKPAGAFPSIFKEFTTLHLLDLVICKISGTLHTRNIKSHTVGTKCPSDFCDVANAVNMFRNKLQLQQQDIYGM